MKVISKLELLKKGDLEFFLHLANAPVALCKELAADIKRTNMLRNLGMWF